MAASHAAIGSGKWGWASRNVIYVNSDCAETLVTLAQKTDIVGIGSFDGHPYSIITGNHVIVGDFMGTRLINMGFRAPVAGGAILTVPTTVSGLKILDCFLHGQNTANASESIVATAVDSLEIKRCRFYGQVTAAPIKLGAGSSNGLVIEDNIIESAAIGILVDANLTCAQGQAIIKDNFFDVGTLVVDDNSSKVAISGSRGRTQSNGKVAETFDYGAALCCDNLITCSASTTSIYPAQASIPA